MFRTALSRIFVLGLLCVFGLVFAQSVFALDGSRFTKYNIHTQGKNATAFKASYANYTDPGVGHVIVPAGTEIMITKSSRRGFVFTYDDGAKKVSFEFHDKRMEMGIDDYLELITSEQPVKNKFSAVDKKGVAEGKAYKGMTRKGVMVALGYPAVHKTPSLETDTWIYWANRFRTVAVDFDKQGKVSNVR